MKNFLLVLSGFLLFSFSVLAQNESHKVSGPDGQLEVQVRLVDGQAFYSVRYKGAVMLEDSPLGLVSSVSDFSSDLPHFRISASKWRRSALCNTSFKW